MFYKRIPSFESENHIYIQNNSHHEFPDFQSFVSRFPFRDNRQLQNEIEAISKSVFIHGFNESKFAKETISLLFDVVLSFNGTVSLLALKCISLMTENHGIDPIIWINCSILNLIRNCITSDSVEIVNCSLQIIKNITRKRTIANRILSEMPILYLERILKVFKQPKTVYLMIQVMIYILYHVESIEFHVFDELYRCLAIFSNQTYKKSIPKFDEHRIRIVSLLTKKAPYISEILYNYDIIDIFLNGLESESPNIICLSIDIALNVISDSFNFDKINLYHFVSLLHNTDHNVINSAIIFFSTLITKFLNEISIISGILDMVSEKLIDSLFITIENGTWSNKIESLKCIHLLQNIGYSQILIEKSPEALIDQIISIIESINNDELNVLIAILVDFFSNCDFSEKFIHSKKDLLNVLDTIDDEIVTTNPNVSILHHYLYL